MLMKMSPRGRLALEQREGCKLKAYKDTKGVPTVGFGHTGRATLPLVRMGMQITAERADAYLTADLAPTEACINDTIRKPMTQNQFDSLCSFVHNIGEHGFIGSTVVHKFNKGDVDGAARGFLMWEKPPELRKRREGEFAQFLTPDTATTFFDFELAYRLAQPWH